MSFIPCSYETDVDELLNWLRCQGGEISSDKIAIRNTPDKGLGVFAAREFAPGEVLFSIPRKCILGIDDALSSALIQTLIGSSFEITGELCIWLAMIEQSSSSSNHYFPYIRTLDHENIPSLLACDDEIIQALMGSNLYQSHMESVARLQTYETILSKFNNEYQVNQPNKRVKREEIAADCASIDQEFERLMTRENIIWARAHYLSRRYPGHLALSSTENDNLKGNLMQERNMGSYGAMCPLLDILNHNDAKDWLKLRIDPSDPSLLHIETNYAIQKNSEIYYNYGLLSNEQLLYGYGYAVRENIHDSVSVQLMARKGNSGDHQSNPTHIGTYYVRQGGFEGIPKELWLAISRLLNEEHSLTDQSNSSDEDHIEVDVEDCEMLLNWMTAYHKRLESSSNSAKGILQKYLQKPSKDSMWAEFIEIYRNGQYTILRDVIEALTDIIENQSGDNPEDDEENEDDEDSCEE